MEKLETTGQAIQTEQSIRAGAFNKKIGNTTYQVGVYFNNKSTETVKDKITRLIQMEYGKEAS